VTPASRGLLTLRQNIALSLDDSGQASLLSLRPAVSEPRIPLLAPSSTRRNRRMTNGFSHPISTVPRDPQSKSPHNPLARSRSCRPFVKCHGAIPVSFGGELSPLSTACLGRVPISPGPSSVDDGLLAPAPLSKWRVAAFYALPHRAISRRAQHKTLCGTPLLAP
jgi:hypothetical protein